MESSSGWLKQIIIFIMCVCMKIAFYKSGELDTKTQKFTYKEQDAEDAVGDLKVESFAPYSPAESTNKASLFFFWSIKLLELSIFKNNVFIYLFTIFLCQKN